MSLGLKASSKVSIALAVFFYAGQLAASQQIPFGFFASEPAASCAGASIGGFCWYLGSAGQSCATVCGSRGGTTAGHISYSGSSGTLPNCVAVVAALSAYPAPADYGFGAAGTGCGVRLISGTWQGVRITNVVTTDAASEGPTMRACSCAN